MVVLFLHTAYHTHQVRVIPLGTIQDVRASSSRTGPFTVDDSIELVGCEVSEVPGTYHTRIYIIYIYGGVFGFWQPPKIGIPGPYWGRNQV